MDKSELILKTTKELKDIAESGANKIALAMQEETKANYINFVSMLYHYSVPGKIAKLPKKYYVNYQSPIPLERKYP
ncbi:hypothetical protein [Vibrio sp. 1F279]|uniref:hypothetical protein n=1 Tax=unclassified Vibrio TaxID=2614977 RepID=UPI00352C06A8